MIIKKNNYEQNNFNSLWFSIIELMIVITIMTILTLSAYIPFSHYKEKQKVKNSAKIITQVLSDSRNSAIYWMASSTWNLDIWVKLETWKWKIWIYWFPINDNIWDYLNPDNKYLLENILLEWGTQITSSWWLILFKAITWSGIYKWDFTITDNKIEMIVWLKWATTWFFSKKIQYYTKTYISDVK